MGVSRDQFSGLYIVIQAPLRTVPDYSVSDYSATGDEAMLGLAAKDHAPPPTPPLRRIYRGRRETGGVETVKSSP